jgi:putative transcriptional regulator
MSEYIINNIREFRTEKNVTQEQLAEVAGVSRQTIIAIEKGNYTPSLSLAMKIASYFRKRVEDVFTLKS